MVTTHSPYIFMCNLYFTTCDIELWRHVVTRWTSTYMYVKVEVDNVIQVEWMKMMLTHIIHIKRLINVLILHDSVTLYVSYPYLKHFYTGIQKGINLTDLKSASPYVLYRFSLISNVYTPYFWSGMNPQLANKRHIIGHSLIPVLVQGIVLSTVCKLISEKLNLNLEIG